MSHASIEVAKVQVGAHLLMPLPAASSTQINAQVQATIELHGGECQMFANKWPDSVAKHG